MYIDVQTYTNKEDVEVTKLVLVADARVWTTVDGKRTTESAQGAQIPLTFEQANALKGVGVPVGRQTTAVTPDQVKALLKK